MQIDALLIEFDKGDCPSPSRVALDLLDLLQCESASVTEAAAIARLDPVLTAKTVKLANSVLYRGLRPSVAVEDAVMRIGLQGVARLALSLSFINGNPALAESFNLSLFWSSALARAIAMQALARRLGGWSTAELFTLGLLCDIGRLVMACSAPEETAAATLAAVTPSELLHNERQGFGFDHRQLSAALLRRWSFPELMASAIEPDEASDELRGNARFTSLLAMLDLSRAIGEWIENLRPEADIGMLRQRSHAWGFGEELLDEILGEIETEWHSMASLFDFTLSTDAREKFERLRQALTTTFRSAQNALPARVLVVDDEASSRELLQRILVPAGYEVLEAADAEQAAAHMQRMAPRIVILDWVMPGVDGIELCRQLREKFGARLYLLILTAHYDAAYTVNALEAGANDFLTKPFSRKLLLAKLQTAVRMVEFIASLEEEHQASQQAQRELTRMNEELRQVVVRDELTGLANRRALDNHLRNAWAQAQRHEHPLTCVMLDIDNFKRVNDEYGHDTGDRALRALARLLQSHSRKGDIAARIGGEEFVLICPYSNLHGTVQLAERIRRRAPALRGDFPPITLSAGVAQMTPEMTEPDELLHSADQALLQAKRNGRNRVVEAGTAEAQEEGA